MKETTKVEVTAKKVQLEQCRTDVLCVGIFSQMDKLDRAIKQLDKKLGGIIENIIKLGDFEGKETSSIVIYTGGKIAAARLMLVGLGERKKATFDTLRKAASAAAKRAVAIKARTMASAMHQAFNAKFDRIKCGQVSAEGLYFGGYRYDEFMTKEEDNGRSESLSVELIDDDAKITGKLEKGIEIGSAIGAAQALVRTLANQPPNFIYPETLAEQAKKAAEGLAGLTCTVFDEKQLKQKKMGGIIAVGQGSVHPPRMIVLKYKPKTKRYSGTVGLIGKAITFDSGGLNIKPTGNIEGMKMDMTGGAVVIGTMKAIAQLKLPINVWGVICCAENAPDGKSYRPNDVITTYSGKTVEVLNTDAEGRIVLCDGIHYARENKCEPIIDIATLTGACMVALGLHKAGIMGNDDKLIAQLQKAAEDAGEPVWHLPSGGEYTEELKSKIADLKNIGSKYGGACTAASFLGEFAGDTKWAHLDIAGKMETSEPLKKITIEGSIGFGLRLFINYLMNIAGK